MILADLVVHSRVNQHCLYSGMDSLECCDNKQHFQNYPYTVDYVYNSRGFRDQEWPDSERELRDAIWCIGDNFTVGLGQPLAHIWPQVLATATGRRCINISMDGASNDWIGRRAQDILNTIRPQHMVIMWSYTHRREIQDPSLNDEQRRLHASDTTEAQDLANWTDLANKIHTLNSDIVQCTIPDFHVDMLIMHDVIHVAQRLDWARDHHHFDILTSQWVVDQIVPRLPV